MVAIEQIKTALRHYDQMTADADDAVSELAESVRAALKAAAEQKPSKARQRIWVHGDVQGKPVIATVPRPGLCATCR